MCYRTFIIEEALLASSDGCTAVSELYQWCCFEHDLAYRYGKDPRDAYRLAKQGSLTYWLAAGKIKRSEADSRFKRCIQEHSPLGRFSPVSYWRWLGVRIGGWFKWRH